MKVCKHVAMGDKIRRISNIGGILFFECGDDAHFNDLTRPGMARLRSEQHFSNDELSVAAALPQACYAELCDGGWEFSPFQSTNPRLTGGAYALTREELETEHREFIASDVFYLFHASNGGVAIVNTDGVRSLPVWVDKISAANAEASGRFGKDKLPTVALEEFCELATECESNGIMFLNLNYMLLDHELLPTIHDFCSVIEVQR